MQHNQCDIRADFILNALNWLPIVYDLLDHLAVFCSNLHFCCVLDPKIKVEGKIGL